jgi:putative serine protease PepD
VDRSKADLITSVDGRPVKSLDDLLSYVEGKKPGEEIVLTIQREVKELKVTIVLEQAGS